jgi:cytochrome c oxidase subunit 2
MLARRPRLDVHSLRPLLLSLVPLLFGATLAFAQGHPQTTLDPKSDVAAFVDVLLDNLVLWCLVIFVVVEGILVYAVLRFRSRAGGPEPKMIHGNTPLEIAWTLAPALILTFIAVPTVKTIFQEAAVPKGGLKIRVIGHQWWWEFQYPELGVVTANELHVPVGRTVDLSLETADVVHSFWIPAFAGKRDVIPNNVVRMWFTASEADTFPGQCAEFCGLSHANMRMRVISLPPDQFDAWAARQKTPPARMDSVLAAQDSLRFVSQPARDAAAESLIALGKRTYSTGLCIACHTVDGVSQGILGPNLTHVGSRSTIAAAMFPNDTQHLKMWLKNPPAAKPGALMPNMNLTDEQAEALAAYLQSLK